MTSEQADLSHELLGGEDQLVVDEPARLLFKQRAVGMNVDCLLMLHCLVAAFTQSCRVIEISCSHGLEEGQERGGIYSQLFLRHDYSSIILKGATQE